MVKGVDEEMRKVSGQKVQLHGAYHPFIEATIEIDGEQKYARLPYETVQGMLKEFTFDVKGKNEDLRLKHSRLVNPKRIEQ